MFIYHAHLSTSQYICYEIVSGYVLYMFHVTYCLSLVTYIIVIYRISCIYEILNYLSKCKLCILNFSFLRFTDSAYLIQTKLFGNDLK